MFNYRDNIEPDNEKEFGSTLSEARKVVQELQRTNWLNKKEGSAMIEIMGYSPSNDLFTLIVVMIELPKVGGAFSTGIVQSLRFHGYIYKYPLWWLSFFLDGLLGFVIVAYSVYVVRKMWKLGVLLFVYNLWNLLDYLIILLAWGMIVVNLSYCSVLKQTVQTYHARRVVQFQYLVTMFLWRSFFYGLTTFVMLLRCFQFLEMLSIFNRFLIVLEHIAQFIFFVVFLLLLQFFTIATFMYMMVGNRHSEFSNWGKSLLNVLMGIQCVVSNVFHDFDENPYSGVEVTTFLFVFSLVVINFITLSFTFAIIYSSFVEFFPKHPEIDRMQVLVKEYLAKQWNIGGKGNKGTPSSGK